MHKRRIYLKKKNFIAGIVNGIEPAWEGMLVSDDETYRITLWRGHTWYRYLILLPHFKTLPRTHPQGILLELNYFNRDSLLG